MHSARFLRVTSIVAVILAFALIQFTVGASDKPYAGEKIVVAGVAGQLQAIAAVDDKWEAKTGATVELFEIPLRNLRTKIMTAERTGSFLGDILYFPTDMGADLMGAGYFQPVPENVKEKLNWQDILPAYREKQLAWGGTTYAYPLDGDLMMMGYRKDIFKNEDYKAKFKEEYGRELEPPTTWKEYEQVAKFFNGWDWDNDGKDEYGTVELPKRGDQLWNGFSARAVAYAKSPKNKAFYFNPKTMEPLVNNPGFVKALEDWMHILNNYAPPGVKSYAWMENMQSFIGGEAAMVIQWTDIGPWSFNPDMSVVAGKTGYSQLPGYPKVWNYKTKQWDNLGDKINRPAYLGFGGWILGVPTNAKKPKIAQDFLTYLSSLKVLTDLSTMSGSGVNPVRESTLENISAWTTINSVDKPDKRGSGMSEDAAHRYLNVIKASLNQKNVVPQLRIPGYAEYLRILELEVSKALAKQKSPEEALNTVAKKWNDLTDRLGRDRQKELYREHLGLSSNE